MAARFIVGVVGVVIVSAGFVGCSSNKSSPTSGPAAASGSSSGTGSSGGDGGQPKVTIDGQDQNVPATTAPCSTVSGSVYIAFGQAITAVLSDENPPVVQSVTLGTVDGVPLAVQPSNGLGSAAATETGTTTNGTFYRITGQARGVGSPQMNRISKSFEIDVTCPASKG